MLYIPRTLIDDMLQHLMSVYDDEGCGILAGEIGATPFAANSREVAIKNFPATNVADDKYVRYTIDSREQMRIFDELDDNDWRLLAIYHSHTHTEGRPSPTDVRNAFFPEAYYILFGLSNPNEPTIRAFRIHKNDPYADTTGEIEELPLEIVEGAAGS